jgi:hypothetical protein
MPGRELMRLYLLDDVYVFGSPTTVAYRSDLVRTQAPFYDERRLHEDTEKCVQLCTQGEIGFVHQVLSFLRVGNESISSAVHSFDPNALDGYIIAQRYADAFLPPDESRKVRGRATTRYYRSLARQALHLPSRAFWQYHSHGLATLGERIQWLRLLRLAIRQFFCFAANPGSTVLAIAGRLKAASRRSSPDATPDQRSRALDGKESPCKADATRV